MGLQQFERRLERLVEGIFAKAFRSGLQPVEIGRRLTREMDLSRTVAPRGTLVPNRFTVALSPSDRDRFAPIEDELISELKSVARDHANSEDYVFLGPLRIQMETDSELKPGMLLIAGEMSQGPPEPSRRPAQPAEASGTPRPSGATLLLADGRHLVLGSSVFTIGRLPDCDLVVADPNVSRRHAEIRPAAGGYEVADLGSTNGTRINGAPIAGRQRLHPGDEIGVGATTVRFETP